MSGLEDGYGAQIGILITCQRCGKTTFRKQTGYNHIDAAIANRHSFLDEFEPAPDGWKIRKSINGWMCSECNDQLDKMIVDFMEK